MTRPDTAKVTRKKAGSCQIFRFSSHFYLFLQYISPPFSHFEWSNTATKKTEPPVERIGACVTNIASGIHSKIRNNDWEMSDQSPSLLVGRRSPYLGQIAHNLQRATLTSRARKGRGYHPNLTNSINLSSSRKHK